MRYPDRRYSSFVPNRKPVVERLLGLDCRRLVGLLLAGAMSLMSPSGFSQTLAPVRVITTVAGNGTNANTGDGGPAVNAEIGKGYDVAIDKAGNLYIAEEANDVVRKIDTNGIITTYAGTSGMAGYTGDGGPAANALLNAPYGVAIDSNGNLLIADEGNQVIRRVDQSGTITTVAGKAGVSGYSGDGGPATSALLHTPYEVGADRFGNFYIADYGNSVVRKVDANGVITTFAGTGTKGYTGDGGPAAMAEMSDPYGVWPDMAGNVYIADYGNIVMRRVDTSGNIHLFAGTVGSTGSSGDGGPATSAKLYHPTNPFGDGLGNIYIADEENMTVREINTSGIINVIAGKIGVQGSTGDGGPAVGAELAFPYGLAFDSSNNTYIADPSNYRIRRLSFNTGLPSTAVGASTQQKLFVESSVAVTPNTAVVTPSMPSEFVLGGLSGCSLGASLAANAPCTMPITFQPTAPGLQTAQLAIADSSGNTSTIGLTGVGTAPELTFGVAAISTIAGNGTAGDTAASGPAISAEVSAPRGGVIDSAGNIYFADSGNNIIRKINAATGTISTVAGTGIEGYAGDGGAATAAQLSAPAKVVVDAAGNLYIADTGNSVIRYVSVSTGLISTVAGNGTAGYTGDSGAATAAELNHPQGLAVDLGGHVYVADTGNNAIRYFAPGTTIVTITGTGTAGYSGDGGNEYGAKLNAPQSIVLDMSGNVFIADTGNDVVRRISATNRITTLAGQQGTAVNAGDSGPATSATLDQPSDIMLDAAGDMYIAAGGQVRMITSNGIISTIAGSGAAGSYSGQGAAATSAVLPSPVSNLMLDSAGNFVLADTAGNRLLKVAAATPMPLNLGVVTPGGTGAGTILSVLNTGNLALNFSGITVSTGFALQAGGSSGCTATTTLAPGQACTLSIAFTPAVNANGVVTGTLTLTDNALNATGATQTVSLSGTAKVIASTTTALTVSSASANYGAAVTLTATISNGSSPTKTVSFKSNGNPIGSANVSNSQATLTLASLPTGVDTIVATYSGDENNGTSTGTGSVTILPAALTVTAANASIPLGGSIPTLSYSISGFVNGETGSVVTGTAVENTTATSTSPSGTYPITVTRGTLSATNYTFTFVNGTLTIQPSTAPDYTITATPSALTVTAGQTGSVTITMTPLNGYKGTVNVFCGPLPQHVGCNLSSTTMVANGQNTPVSAQLTISTDVPQNLASNGDGRPANTSPVSLAFGMPLCLLGMALFKGRRCAWRGVPILLLLLAILVTGVSSCGGNNSKQLATTGTYQLTVLTADSADGLTHPATVTVTVQ